MQRLLIVNVMKKILYVLSISAALFLASCNKDDDAKITPPREYTEVYAEDIVKIEDYLNSHSIVVTKDGNGDVTDVVFGETSETNLPSIMDQTEYPILHKIVRKHDIDYKVYYLKLDTKGDTDLDGKKPSGADKVLTTYKGYNLDNTGFDSSNFGTFFDLTGVISGWQYIIPEFRSGDNSFNNDGTTNFTNYGSGVMFVPSGLAYFNSSSSGIGTYASLIFTFNLHQVIYLDHDNDGILSRYEFGFNTDGTVIDTDGDGVPDYVDVDDDNDGYLTKEEIKINGVTPDFENILNCSGTTGGLKKHLDTSCH